VNRRATIATAAADLIARQGFGGVSVEDIAHAVGVTPGALYRHFPGKEAVLSAVLHETVSRLLALIDSAATLHDLMSEAVALALDRPGLLAAYVRERHRVEDAELRKKETRVRESWARVADPRSGRMALRQKAVIGALPVLTSKPVPVPRARLEELLARAMIQVMECPLPDTSGRPPPSPRWRPSRGRREEILAAALELFHERGFAGASVDEIGRAAGLAGSGIYRYYTDKTEILIDAYERAGARVEVGAENAVAEAADAADALRRLTRSYAGVALSDVDLVVVTAREGFALPEPERASLARRAKHLRDLWVSVGAEVRPDLGEAEVHALVEASFPLINEVAQFGGSMDEAVALTLALFG
jgi:AcrR family transcriptional regulator